MKITLTMESTSATNSDRQDIAGNKATLTWAERGRSQLN
jgi:hypothetical protein